MAKRLSGTASLTPNNTPNGEFKSFEVVETSPKVEQRKEKDKEAITDSNKEMSGPVPAKRNSITKSFKRKTEKLPPGFIRIGTFKESTTDYDKIVHKFHQEVQLSTT